MGEKNLLPNKHQLTADRWSESLTCKLEKLRFGKGCLKITSKHQSFPLSMLVFFWARLQYFHRLLHGKGVAGLRIAGKETLRNTSNDL